MSPSCVRRIFVCLSVLLVAALTFPVTAAAMVWSDAMTLNSTAATDDDHRDYYLSLADDGAGHWVCVWCMGVGSGQDRDFDILVTRSDDNGDAWTAPAILDPFADAPPEQEFEDDFHPFVVTDGVGHWVATWYTHDNHGGTIGDDTDILVSVSTNGGATWTPSVPLNTDAETDTISDNTPVIATDGQGLWVAIWNRVLTPEADTDLVISHSLDNGETWSAPVLFHPSMASDPGYNGMPWLATDKAGHWVLVWTSEDPLGGTIGTDQDILVSCSTNGLTWTDPAPLNSDAATSNGLEDRQPRLAWDGAGRWLAVWYYGEWPEYDIKFSYSDDHGATWSAAQYLNDNALTDAGRDMYPVPAADGRGNWVVVWQSNEPLTPPVGTDYDIFYSYSTDNAATWAPVGLVNAYGESYLEFGYDRDPEVGFLGDGMWLTAWGTNYDLGGSIGTDYDLMRSYSCLPRTSGDYDCDGDVDLDDFAEFLNCLSGPIEGAGFVSPSAVCLDAFDVPVPDGDVDLPDFAAFQEAFDGSGG
jgi:hypothetical protein